MFNKKKKKKPSDPKTICWKSGPLDILGTLLFFSTIPLAVTILASITKSSIFPYTFFFMPDARVATQPPKLIYIYIIL